MAAESRSVETTEARLLAEQAIETVRREAAGCRNCPLWGIGTQTVFGVGPTTARLMLIGEAPGQQEDEQGVPFVGPAGRLLDEALREAGIDRREVWITNVVKHRPWVPQGTRKKNRPPKVSEIRACHPWLEQELTLIQAEVIVCLGALAAREILGKDFKLTQQRGRWLTSDRAPHVLATIHPSYVLIQPEGSRDRVRQMLFDDLALVGARHRQSGLAHPGSERVPVA